MADATQHSTLEHELRRDDKVASEAPAREPVKAPESLHASEGTPVTSAEAPAPETEKSKDEGNFFKRDLKRWNNEIATYRKGAITALPAPIVNNGSNAVALTHLVGELFMFKANNTDLVSPKHRGVWWRYVTDPPVNILKSVSQNAGVSMKAGDLLKPEFYKDTIKGFFNLEHATNIDKARGLKLINRWQARSTFAGLTGMSIAAIVPDRPDDPEEVEKYAMMAKRNPMGYAAKRVTEGVLFVPKLAVGLAQRVLPGGSDGSKTLDSLPNKREFSGLLLTFTGLFSFLSGFRNVGRINPAIDGIPSNLKYVPNLAHAMGGAITALAGSRLLLALDNDQGWRNWGSIQQWRLAFLPKSIMSRYDKHDPRANWYLGGQGLLQGSNVVSILIGGAEKREDGSIVDHEAIRAGAKLKAHQATESEKENKLKGDVDEKNKASDGRPSVPKNFIASNIAHEQRLAEAPTVAKDGA